MKYFYALLFSLTFPACDQPKESEADKSQSGNARVVNAATPANALQEYALFVSKLDTFNVETATLAAKKYQDLFKNEDGAARDKGFIIFNAHYERLDKSINELHEKDTTDFDPLIMLDDAGKSLPVPQKLKEYSDRLKRNGFEVSSTEGISYIQQDRDFITKWFYSYVSSTMKEYLEQLNKENKEGFQEDAGLTLEPKQYVSRLIWWENFIQRNPQFSLIDKAEEQRKYLLTFFLIGMDNSPVLDYENNQLDDYYKTAYGDLERNYPHSETNKIVNPYYKALQQNNPQKATSILDDYKKKAVIIDFDKG